MRFYELISVKEFPKLAGPGGSAFIAVGTNEWQWGVPNLGGTFDLDEEIEVEDVPTPTQESPDKG